jgi:hypothetical protein
MSNYPSTQVGVTSAQTTTNSLGYDLSGVQDLTNEMAEVGEVLCWLQALARRICTPRGRLINDLNYGFDVTDWLDDDILPTDLTTVATGVDTEFLKDERTLSSSTTVITVPIGTGLGLVITSFVMPQGGSQTFQFVLTVSQAAGVVVTSISSPTVQP